MGNLEVRIEVAVDTKDEIKELVRLAADIQKEYSCHCTLFVKQHYLLLFSFLAGGLRKCASCCGFRIFACSSVTKNF